MHPFNCWYAVLEAPELGARKPLAARRFGVDLVFWRDEDGSPRCVADRCPHRGAALSTGKVRDGQIECPFHGFRFDGAGDCVKVPCNGPDQQRPKHLATRAYELREAHGYIWLWWGEARDSYPEIAFFEDLAEGWEFSRFKVDTAVNWMRNVENQLDFPHLPFVHSNTIGTGMPPQMEIKTTLEGDRLEVWMARDEDAAGVPSFKLTYQFPNLWHNPIAGGRFVAVAAFVPIDETHSRMYFRSYMRRLPIPGLARLLGGVMDIANRLILAQDLRVVHTQPPGPTADERDENLVQGDLPIAQFRREVRHRAGPDPQLVALRGPESKPESRSA